MKNVSLKAVVSLVLAVALCFGIMYVPTTGVYAMAAEALEAGLEKNTKAVCEHSFTGKTTDVDCLKSVATCEKKAVYYYTCIYCDAISPYDTYEYGSALGHNWSTAVSVAATCTQPAMKKRECSRCGQTESFDKTGEALGHKIQCVVNNNGTHTNRCSRVGCGFKETVNCTSATAVCGEKATCDYCKSEFLVSAHDLSVITVTEEATCEKSGVRTKKCSRCDYYETETIPATDHKYETVTIIKNATCTADGSEKVKCAYCGKEAVRIIPLFGHDYQQTVVEPTCQAQGYTVYVCSNCQDTHMGNYTPVASHNYELTVVAPTCSLDGYTVHTCKTCGHSFTDSVVSKTGHIMGELVEVSAPTCTEKGVYTKSCTQCSSVETLYVDALGHDNEDTVVSPTCTNEGYTLHRCKRCGNQSADNYVAATGHILKKEVLIEPTCTAPGKSYDVCQVCNYKAVVDTEALDHSFTNYVSNGDAKCEKDGTKTAKCDRCDQKDTIADPGSALEHSFTYYIAYTDPTCTEDATQKAVCDNGCGKVDIRTAPGTAKGHYPVTDQAKPATCTEVGYAEGKHCGVCNAVILAQAIIPALGHDFAIHVITEPTCSQTGTATYTCKRCSYSYTGDVPATGIHTWDMGETTFAPTCEDEGTVLYTCTFCKTTETRTIPNLGHDWEKDYTLDRQTTCYQEGEKSIHCSRCEGRKDVQSIPRTEHQLGEFESDNNATCTEDGTISKKCKFCTYKVTEIDVGSKLGHNFENYVPNGDASCEVDGTKTAKCTRCAVTDTLADAGSATGHKEEINIAVEATCTKSGLTQGKSCKYCGMVLVAQEVVPALGHKEVIKPGVAPTCTKTGLKDGVYCTRCKEDLIEQEVIAKKGHSYKSSVTKATTSSNGKIVKTCKTCGTKKTSTIYKVKSFKLSTSSFYYNGKAQVPTKAVVKDSKGNTLKAGEDYEINYGTSSKKIGTYSVKIVLKGNYKGSKTLSFKIIPGKTTVKATPSTTSIKLSWSASKGATGYRVYRYDSSKKKWVKVKSSTTSKAYTVKDLKAATSYKFGVKPFYKNSDGTVVWGKLVTITTSTKPSKPTNVKLKKTSASSVNVSWTKSKSVTGYVVYYSTTKDGTYVKAGSTKSTSFKIIGLKTRTYYIKVRAYKKTSSGNVYSSFTTPKSVSLNFLDDIFN